MNQATAVLDATTSTEQHAATAATSPLEVLLANPTMRVTPGERPVKWKVVG